ncbi:MAG TPA: branched-chain amino acid ABC transporter substrate-binding protein [Candidatus Sulfotelmatobacter sp.]|jgi:branched-chain amino acid transport system substrate-binding protein|nr:branched-chain amino acid ABC transporter substrate-binding protein [Candidatus Sulfotelmatobacter sp.]
MRPAKFGALAITTVLVFAACSNTGSASGGGGGGKTITIGTELPMSGAETANGQPTANGVKLAIKQENAKGDIPGYTLAIEVEDDAVNGAHDPQQGATNMHTLVADTTVMGVVGPFNSSVAQAEIPISNAGGLLQCSPANTNTGLTYPPDSAQYRPTNPNKINYIRTAAPDSIQGPAGADYVYNDLKATSVYILDDTETFGVGVGDSFAAEFKKDGGTVTKRDSAPKSTTDYTPLFTAAAAAHPQAVYLAGTTPTGMGLALKQGRTVAGFETIPFMGPDGVADLGPGGTTGATITVAGSAAHDVFGTVAGIHDLPSGSTFVADYTTEFGSAPGAYSAAAYACAQVIIAGIKAAVTAGTTDPAAMREAVRAQATAAGNKFDTVVGSISFDKNGDITTPYMSFYKTDLTLDGGKGDWVYVKQQAFTDPNA